MTTEQEQLIREIAAGLQNENYDAGFDGWQGGYCCPLCNGAVIFDDPLNRKGEFKHAPNCLRTLAKRLLATLKDNDYECLLCNGDPAATKEDFKHTPDCPLILAQQLRDTLDR